MIFYGPPGTGKTMAAQVMANRLGMELYKVDMAGVMSKYIGESEKKLGNIFRQAAKSQSILFFDEADALFGKRTEQRDSNDKYANASTAYLLQKIEEYEGVMILATNLLQNFDSAFLRRFKYVIEFPFTDITRRRKIWEHVFPAEVPREMLDVEFLAEEYKFSGSQIKNVAVAAAFLAAAKKEKVTMKHVLTGVKRELAKTGKQMIASDFGPYYYLMEEQEE
ncbi:ATP-binding protein [Clostridiaceae bacterium Marseille-Q4143]|nr:ATP-binding protein [Clostridiaceae bacterium Marseille-Q4145]QUO23675.1 ATP-binding protein [Clostridiaceae bacterium Marseille-Q4143]